MFALKVFFYKALTKGLKLVGKVIRIKQPLLFVGKDTALVLCDSLQQAGHQHALLVTDKVLVELGLIAPMQERLRQNGLRVTVFDGVLPDPTIAQVEAGLTLTREQQCDSVLAIGGGSVIDAAKAIAACFANQKTVSQLTGYLKVRRQPLPLYAIPTTAGTGSEATVAAVISDDGTHKKNLLADPKLLPLAAALDEQLMLALPPSITAATGMDALTHAIEAYVSTIATPESDRFALQASALIFRHLEPAYNDGQDKQARRGMALAAFYAGAAITQAGVGYVHAFAHHIGAQYGTPHGIANAMILPRVLAYSFDRIVGRLAALARHSGLSDQANDTEAAQALIDEVNRLLGVFNIPVKHEKLDKQDVPALVNAALTEAHYMFYAVPKYLNKKQSKKLLEGMLVSH